MPALVNYRSLVPVVDSVHSFQVLGTDMTKQDAIVNLFRDQHEHLRFSIRPCNYMEEKTKRFQIAILLYPGVTALDAVGPWEVLSRMPATDVRFVGKEVGPLTTEGGALLLGVSHTVAETPSADLVLVPGGSTTPGQMVDDEVLDWLRNVHETTTWTASVCSGALILGAAGILKGLPATTHWYKMGALKMMGAKPEPNERIVRSGKIITAAGVSTWRFGWQAKLLAARRPKQSSWSSNMTHTHRSMPGT